METKQNLGKKGSVLIIAMLTVAFLAALAVALINPVSTAEKVSTEAEYYRMATLAANSAAERIKYVLCQPGADLAVPTTCTGAISASVTAAGWVPATSYNENGGIDEAGITFPSLDQLDATGHPLFVNPDVIGVGRNQCRYIAYSYEDGTGNAVSYVSAEFEGVVRNIRVNYTRPIMEMPNESYLNAAYCANMWNGGTFTFKLMDSTYTNSTWTNWSTWNQPSTGQPGCVNIQRTRSKGYLGFNIPSSVELAPGTVPKLKVYCQNVPGNATCTVSVRDIGAPWGGGWMNNTWLDNKTKISEITASSNDIKHEYVEFEIQPDMFQNYIGSTLNVAFEFEDTTGNSNSTIHFKFKDGYEPVLDYETNTVGDSITGDVFINGDADITGGLLDGSIKTTGDTTGDATGDVLTGVDNIDPPDLSQDGEWYQDLKVSADGYYTTNTDVVTDASDGSVDGKIGGIICKTSQNGENQPYMDAAAPSGTNVYVLDGNFGVTCKSGDPTYNSGTDSTIVTVPDAYNNKAIFIPGDFWIDILDPTYIDFRTPSGAPASLTFIVKGNVYMTDGINKLKHPSAIDGGILSVIALKRDDGTGGNINYGDPSGSGGRIDPISAFLYAENDFTWNSEAQQSGDFDILGNMTAGGIIDLQDRGEGNDFVPINVLFDRRILDPEFRNNLPMLPPGNTVMILSMPYGQQGFQYIE